ncbi:MAG TPA: NAD(P)-dependent oxidoreductase [Clostridia bacterium]
MKVLLTGIGGFIGSHLAKAWQDAALDFVGVSRRKLSDNNEFQLIYCDLANGVPYEKSVDIIVHAAAKSPSPDARIEDFVSSNVEGTRKLLEYAVKHGVSKFIYLSSVSVYGTVQVPIVDEETAVVDPGIYGMTKLIGELLVKEAGLKSSIALRLPGVLGPGAKTPWLCKVLDNLKNNMPVEYFNPYSPFNNLLHVDDLDMFIRHLFSYEWEGFNVVTLASKRSMPVRHLLEGLKRKTGSLSELIELNDNRKSFQISTKKAVSIGFNPICSDNFLDELI